MRTKFMLRAFSVLALGAVALSCGFEGRHGARLAGVQATPAMSGSVEQEIVRNVLQHLWQNVRDQIRSSRVAAGRSSGVEGIPIPTPDPRSSGSAK
jgi:hypothetical protein